ncbi:MAG: hypothetical protein JRG90_18195 [Deltaproteobacteria bacterium]|nr:hypothetical protein [Deltaproteobacteria bacterium]
MTAGRDEAAAGVQARVRRFAVLRAAQRSLNEVAPFQHLSGGLDLGRRLLRKLRTISGETTGSEVIDPAEALRAADALLADLADRIHDALKATPTRALCNAVAPLAKQEPGTVRSLAAVVLEGDLESEPPLRLLEYIVTALACEGPPGDRKVVREPLDALPELADIDLAEAHESDPSIDEAEQIFGRAVLRLDEDVDLGATRDRIRDYKRRLGARILHPTVMAAAVAYNAAMGNRLAQLIEGHRALDAFADTLLGPASADEEGTGRAAIRAAASAAPRRTRRFSRLFWQVLANVGLTVLLLTLAVSLWPRSSVDMLEAASAADLSPHLIAGYMSGNDGIQHFVGTVGDSWESLDLPERRRVVARIAARLEERGVGSVVLMDPGRRIQARHEAEVLLWVTAPNGPE